MSILKLSRRNVYIAYIGISASSCSLSYDRYTASSDRGIHRVWSSASTFNFEYFISLRSSSSCLHLLPLLSATSIFLSMFPSIVCCRRQFLCNIWPIHLAFLLFIVLGYSSQPWLKQYCFISQAVGPIDLLQPFPVPHFKTFQVFMIFFPKCSSFSTV